ncbi:SPOR domain-containing protein [Undibacterium sp. Jales W-56]|uniref:SPOR domain-containing protein n=1 Tax=Undibacterium sp. Jales W-56 TaxID=2897325 RepID=UPI0021D21A8A|nr:SPOR domain-containing protein [Undibacterium sp. Jales W-56]MCU6433275.1 SPOR domain-containing protein [Undibacterium sp. Jales W-56]
MGLFSLFKQKQDASHDRDDGEFRARTEDETKPTRGSSKRAENARKNKLADPVLPEKKRARRRLIGAVALVLAAVIGLPLLLDSEPKPLADDIAIQIPSKDKPPAAEQAVMSKKANKRAELPEEIIEPSQLPASSKNTATLPLAGLTENKAATKAEAKVEAKSEKTLELKPEPKVQADTKTAPKVEAKTDIKSAKNDARPESKTDTKASAKTTAKPNEQDEDAARALAILEGKSVKPVAKAEMPAKEHAYVVQAGAFATQEKINEVQDKLKAAGIKSYTQKVATTPAGDKSVTRIRVGPFDSREEADKTTAKLVKLGLSPKLIPN